MSARSCLCFCCGKIKNKTDRQPTINVASLALSVSRSSSSSPLLPPTPGSGSRLAPRLLVAGCRLQVQTTKRIGKETATSFLGFSDDDEPAAEPRGGEREETTRDKRGDECVHACMNHSDHGTL